MANGRISMTSKVPVKPRSGDLHRATALTILESIRLDLGYGMDVH